MIGEYRSWSECIGADRSDRRVSELVGVVGVVSELIGEYRRVSELVGGYRS